jgi:vitamin B12 transporter
MTRARGMSSRRGPHDRGHYQGIGMALLALLTLDVPTITMGQTPTQTESAPYELEPVIVTGTIVPTTLSRTPAQVTVISREQITAQQTASVTEILRQVPGLHIDQPGARGSVSSVYVRGADPNFTVVLIDGVKVNDPTNSRGGSFDFSTLSTDNIDRIEIVRGPLSAIYGSDALSGAINIITRRDAPQPGGSLEVSGGRFGYYRAIGEGAGALGPMDYAVSGSYLDNGAPIEGSEFAGSAFHANVGFLLSDHMELRSVLRYTRHHAESFPDDSGGPTFAVLRDVDKRDMEDLTLGFTFTHTPVSWWEYNLQITLYDRQERFTSPGVAPGVRDPFGIPPNAAANDFRRYEITLRHIFSVARGVQFAVGAQWQSEQGDSNGHLLVQGFAVPTSFALSRDIWAPFFEVQLAPLSGLQVQGSVRFDLPEGFATEVSPRVGIAYTIEALGTTLRANWGEGFKLPSFFALGHPIVGNPGLLPETSRSVDAGISQALWGKRVTVSATYFHNEFTNGIDFDEGPPPMLVNRSKITTEGVEISLRVQPWPALSATAHATYVHTDIQGTTEQLRNRPAWRGGFTVQWNPVPQLNLSLHTLVVGEVLDSSIPTGDQRLDTYARVDLAATWTLHKHWKFFLGVDNLFDASYEEVVGFPAPGITPRGGIRGSF